MAWSTPLTAVANSALTAAQWNASVRDNLNETAPAKFTAAGQILVSTAANVGAARTPNGAQYTGGGTDATNSTTYIALTGGPSVTATTGTKAIVSHGAQMSNDTAGSRCMSSYAISGATTLAAGDNWATGFDQSGTGRIVKCSWVQFQTALTSGSNVFTGEYRVNGNTGTFVSRNLAVFPL